MNDTELKIQELHNDIKFQKEWLRHYTDINDTVNAERTSKDIADMEHDLCWILQNEL